MKKLIATAVLVFVAFGTARVFSDDEAETPKSGKPAVNDVKEQDEENAKPSVWMRIKMKSTTGVLTGLAAGDFQMIQDNAQRMYTFSRLERLARGKDEEYQLQLKLYRYANRELMRQASERNLEGATMAFTQLTTSCVNCHRMLREPQNGIVEAQPDLTHVIQREVEYYVGGPQQARPPEGKFAKGTKVRVIKAAGSYTQVESEHGVVAFVASASLAPSAADQPRE